MTLRKKIQLIVKKCVTDMNCLKILRISHVKRISKVLQIKFE
jgi:hypothetical protein